MIEQVPLMLSALAELSPEGQGPLAFSFLGRLPLDALRLRPARLADACTSLAVCSVRFPSLPRGKLLPIARRSQ